MEAACSSVEALGVPLHQDQHKSCGRWLHAENRVNYADMSSESAITNAIRRRGELAQLLMVAAILALGVNLVAQWVGDHQSLHHHVGKIGVLLVSLSLLWLVIVTFRRINTSIHLEGAFLLDRRSNRLIRAADYAFANDVAQAVNAVLAENKAIEHAWDAEPLRSRITDPKDHPKPLSPESGGYIAIARVETEHIEPGKSTVLIREALEYVLLEALALHLEDYFNGYPDEDRFITRISRDHIPTMLLENRVLSLLTSNFEDRAPFVGKTGLDGNVYVVYGADGTMYSRFELIVPKGTKIVRLGAGAIALDNSRLHLELHAHFAGMTNNELMHDFAEMRLNRNSRELEGLQVEIVMQYSLKRRALFWRSGWEYYQWADSFAEWLQSRFGVEQYMQRISWPAVHATLLALAPRLSRLERDIAELSSKVLDDNKDA